MNDPGPQRKDFAKFEHWILFRSAWLKAQRRLERLYPFKHTTINTMGMSNHIPLIDDETSTENKVPELPKAPQSEEGR